MSGTILLTGPNGGIGVGFVTQLLKSPYAITHSAIYAVRDPEKALALKAALKNAPKGHKYLILPVDFESLASTRAFAADVNSRVKSGSLPPIQALILNAGVQDLVIEKFTKDGMERTFQINYLANFQLTLLLLKSIDKQHGRIIYISSTAADPNWGSNGRNYTEDQKRTIVTSVENMSRGVEEFPDGSLFRTGQRRYALSKLLLGGWMYEIQRRLDGDSKLSNISVLGHDPGWIGGTSIIRNGPFLVKALFVILRIIGFINSFFSANSLVRTIYRNGSDLLRVCFDQKAFGEYPKALYIDGSVLYHTPKEAQDVEMQKRLWKESLVCAGIKEGDTVLENWK